MKKIKVISLILSLSLLIGAIQFVIFAEDSSAAVAEPEYYTFDDGMGKEEIPYGIEDTSLSKYGYSEMTMYNAQNAAAAGVPAGFEGNYVMKLTNTKADLSFVLDLRQTVCNGVKIDDVESVRLRVWIPYKFDLRLKTNKEWNYNKAHTPAEGGGWVAITISDMSMFVDDGNGGFSPFSFTFRNNYIKEAPCTVYVDGITVKLKEVVEEPTETETSEVETEIETEVPVAPDPLYYSFADGKGKEEIPYGEKSSVGAWYDYNNFRMMNEEQAKYAGVPEGYSGWVLALDPSGSENISIGLDLTGIRTKNITKITFRVWCPTGTKQDSTDGGIRLTGAASNTWSAKISPSAIGEWIDVTLEKDDYSFLDFDGNGYCDPINFCFRGANSTAYIDAITVELKPADANPPVITYEGETVINTTAGKPFVLDASAYDAEDDEYITLEYIWNGDALDADGLLVEGSYTLKVKATDTYGNTSELVLTVNVGPEDTEAPVIGWTPDVEAVYAMKGAKPSIRVSVTDNTDKVEAVLIWSEGALDEAGRLTEGLHTLTISATDLSGNHSEYTVLFYVTASRPTVGNISQDS